MKIIGLGICPPPTAKKNPCVTPELLASSLARYSRSNKGIDTILSSIDWNDPDKSVDAIFKFVDYGHASIAGMTGGIAIVIDGCSMFLAYKLFELSPYSDGQESSTRYIKLDASSLPLPEEIGIPEKIAPSWTAFNALAFDLYHETYNALDKAAQAHPEIVQVPSGANDLVIGRIRKNYALDRARYFIPFATKTNAALVMSARAWAETIRQLDSLPLSEAHTCATGLRRELAKFAPRLAKHSLADEASKSQAEHLIAHCVERMNTSGIAIGSSRDEVFISVDNTQPSFLPQLQTTPQAFKNKKNRYSTMGTAVRRTMVRAAWNNMAIAELRDLNRHRTGYRFSPLMPVGFYLPGGVSPAGTAELLKKQQSLLQDLIREPNTSATYLYGLLLGTQVAFEHSTHLDKFIYEIELRTGIGAHFRYAEHLKAANDELLKKMPQLAPFITIGTAEPE